MTTPGSGVYDSSAFTWNTSGSNPAGYTFSVVDQAGNVASKALTFASDTTAPTGVLTLGPSPVGALLTPTTLYYRSNAPGSFTLVDTVTDTGAGPASATFPVVSTSGWAHAAQTVTSGTGTGSTIAYGSSQYTWTAGAGAPSSTERTITVDGSRRQRRNDDAHVHGRQHRADRGSAARQRHGRDGLRARAARATTAASRSGSATTTTRTPAPASPRASSRGAPHRSSAGRAGRSARRRSWSDRRARTAWPTGATCTR